MKNLLLRHGPFALCLLPLLTIVAATVSNSLGPDPAERLMHMTGEWAARILILCLLMSPMRRWTGNPYWMRQRRMLGLFAFFYACIHLLIFLQFFLGWSAARVAEELAERPYITAGFLAWLVMLPMAVSSTKAMQRRLGRNWQRLHRGIYIVAIAISLHILWQARSDVGEALVYGAAFGALLAWRVWRRFSRSS
jgi:sulfoxide reductase heme-binding subunit YedZ